MDDFTVKFYKNSSNVLKFNKSTELIRTETVKLKNEKDVLTPTLILDSSHKDYIDEINFFEIVEFGRRYIKQSVSEAPGGRIFLLGEVDVLTSPLYHEDVANILGVVERSTNYIDPNVRDELKPLMPYKQRTTVNFRAEADDVLAVDDNGDPIYSQSGQVMHFSDIDDDFVLILNG